MTMSKLPCPRCLKTVCDCGTATNQVVREQGIYPVDTYNENLLKSSRAIEELTEALRELHDVQNGPPLVRYEEEWKEAMRKAEEALKKYES